MNIKHSPHLPGTGDQDTVKKLRKVVRGQKVYAECEELRYGEIKERYWVCYDLDGYRLHAGQFSSLEAAVKQLEGIR